MKIVSNTGPILALCFIEHLEVLQHLFEEVYITEKVRDEILAGGTAKEGVDVFQKVCWIQVKSPILPTNPLLKESLDDGEASVIQFAVENEMDYVLIDEKKGRNIARSVFRLRVIGTARILVEAKLKGLIPNVGKLLYKLTDLGYRIDEKIIRSILKEAGEL